MLVTNEKLQNVTAVTDALPWSGNIKFVKDRRLAMKKELMLLALRFALFVAPVAITYLVSLEGYFG